MKPLEGIRVIDMTTFLAAPTAARMLGEWGADVIKVEAPKADPARTQAAVFNMPYSEDENPAFDIPNANKRFVCVNLKNEKGKEVIYKLLSTADVLLTNYRTKALVKLGLSYEEIHKRFPKIVFAQILGFGEKGPEKDTAGFDATAYVSRGGLLGSMHERGGSPINPVNGYGDFQCSLCLAGGVAAALVARGKTGEGDKVTVSLHHTALFMMNIAVVSAQYGNEYPRSRKEVVNPFNNSYMSKDGRWFIFCAPEYDRDFGKVMTMLGRPDLIDNEDFNTIGAVNSRHKNREIIDIISTQMAQKNLDELIRLFKDNDVPFEKGYTPDEILKDEQAWANDCLRMVKYDNGDERVLVTGPVRFKSMEIPDVRPSRPLGFHTAEILQEIGYSMSDIENMQNDCAVK